jgi:hypothetical protein
LWGFLGLCSCLVCLALGLFGVCFLFLYSPRVFSLFSIFCLSVCGV